MNNENNKNNENSKNNLILIVVLAIMYWFIAGRGIDQPDKPTPTPVPVNPLPIPPSPFPTPTPTPSPGEGEIGGGYSPSTPRDSEQSVEVDKSVDNTETEKEVGGYWSTHTEYVRGGLFGMRRIPVQRRVWVNARNTQTNTNVGVSNSSSADCGPSG